MGDAELIQRIPGRADLADVRPYGAPQVEAAVRLNTNESPYAPPPALMETVSSRLASADLHRYPDRDFNEARGALAAHVGTLTDRVWLASGSNEVILQVMLAFGGVERKAITFEPSYAMHTHIARISGTRLVRGRRGPDFGLELEATVDAVASQEPDIVFLCSPNNPTGNQSSEDVVRAVCGAAPGLVLLDEAYAEFAGYGLLRLVEEFDNLVVTRSFSKAWRLAGARIGYLVGQPAIIEELLKVRLPYHLSTPAQIMILAALEHADELMATLETIRHERDRIFSELSTMRGITAFPSQANFILFRCQDQPAPEVWQALLESGVLIRDFSGSPGAEGCLRVSVGTPEENERFLQSLFDILQGG